MGRLLEEYIAANVPALENIVRGGIPQPEGATTFPGPQEPEAALQGQPIGPGGAPTGPMAALPGPGGIAPGAAATPTFDPAAGAPPQPAMPPAEGQAQQDRSGEFEATPDSFAGMSENADPEDIDKATKAMEEGGVDIDEEYAKVTGSEKEESEDDPKGTSKGEGLTRQEKALILMEFGLNLMASSGTGEGTIAGDIGQAGATALTGHMGRKAAQKKQLAEAEEQKLERELKRAQIKKAGKAATSIKTDQAGNMIIVNEDTGESKPVMMDGKPVVAGDKDKLDFEVKRAAFKAAYGSTIKDAEELERRAVAFANSVRQVAFPQLARQDAAKAILKELNEGKNASQKFVVNGVQKRWKNMTYEEKTKTARELVDMAMEAASTGVTSSDGAGANFGLSDEQVKGMETKTKYQLTSGKWVKKENGKLVEVDPPAQ
jgi:hypothetical protein